MRMWMIDPKLLCRQHLLGEHGELHKFLPSFKKKHRVDRRISPIVQIELSSYQKRHDELADEMNRRYPGSHKSPLVAPDISYLPESQQNAKVDIVHSFTDLEKRCTACAQLIKQNKIYV